MPILLLLPSKHSTKSTASMRTAQWETSVSSSSRTKQMTSQYLQDSPSNIADDHEKPQEDVKDRKDSMVEVDEVEPLIDSLDDIEVAPEDEMEVSATTFESFDPDTSMADEVEATSEDTTEVAADTADSFDVDTSMEESIVSYYTVSDDNTASSPTRPTNDEAEDSQETPEESRFDTAAQKVLATYSLVERIFLKLPEIESDQSVKMLVLAQGTNKTFRQVIRRSFKFRRVMRGRKESLLRSRRSGEACGR
ncbi:hypothetical protein M409DRAFT_22836 [Zasmidium cellare ATCC 36951]|uniref:Uncharacterized protein n=1 Tax=Zasmidium cellare ATCC 36951 TaxID=1080233 RepID=A0A6A6CJK2_ZASCE|nr:uncharacterized protein M409DRAFT_22836 [Zasmidium cellare ATCC 36951]KAF2166783.1 hypothetical protein M409DRAFT_22836 [Zasmidium cellare ATCC 36951]